MDHQEHLDGPIKQIVVLKKKPNSDEALKILNQCSRIVKGMMQKRNWIVKVVEEFFPSNPNLQGLNINRSRIKIRMRLPDK